MNIIRKAVTTLGGIFLAALLIAALAPKTARGIAAALVQVTNTSSNPVPTVMSGTPFEAATCHSFGATQGALCGAQSSDFVVPSITAAGAPVKRLVVEHVSGICTGENTPLIAAILIGPFVADAVPNTAGSMFHYFPLILQTTGPGPSGLTEQDYSFGGTTRIYFNPGDTVTQRTELFVPSNVDALCFAQVEGTLVTQ
jgi:hypothetical protein